MKRKISTLIALALLFSACKKENPVVTETPVTKVNNPTVGSTAVSTVTYTDESAFVTSLSSYGYQNPTQVDLNRIATSAGYNTVYGFNIPAANQVKGFKWNAGDEETTDWRPQGITGFTWGTRKFILVTWYGTGPDDIAGANNKFKGVRIALVDITDMTNITYRLALLVQSKANINNTSLYDQPTDPSQITQLDSFIPITIHAGGVAYYNQKIYVADTGHGLRVFDLNKFIPATTDATSKTIGKASNGDLKAFNYTYVLPETGYYKITNASPYSFVELGTGTTATDLRLWTGQYLTGATDAPKLYGYQINAAGTVSGPPTIASPKDDTGDPVLNMQGAYRGGTQTFMTKTGNSSYEGSTARLVKYIDGAATGTRYRWPHGAEDLFLDSSGLLWNLTEYETSKYGQDNRTVFCVKLSTYQ
jgi:hypothetical protein